MKSRSEARWIIGISSFLVVSLFAVMRDAGAQAAVSTACLKCHSSSGWLDNGPTSNDVKAHNALAEQLPLNLSPAPSGSPFYKIGDAYSGSIHSTPSFAPTLTDQVTCQGCHGNARNAHFGTTAIPSTSTCGNCHDTSAFLSTAHANSNSSPDIFFDQLGKGKTKATTFTSLIDPPVALYKSNQKTAVTRNLRIEECSVCHNYALQYPHYTKGIAQGKIPDPQVGCAACHNAHIPAPSGSQLPTVSSTVSVARVSGSTVLSATPGVGRQVSYRNLKPYKVDDTGAQNLNAGTWRRGSQYAISNLTILTGTGTMSSGPNRFTSSAGGFLANVQADDTLFISGTASTSTTLPANATPTPNAPITVQATLDKAGFEIVSVIDDNTLEISPTPTRSTNVTYTRAGGTSTLSVAVPLTGSFSFEIRNMNTNTETLCGSCHTQGTYKYSVFGKKPDKTFVDVSATHNKNVLAQYRNSGHADITTPAFEEFSARPYGGSHATTYPFDMSITGSGGVGTLRNGGNTKFDLTVTPSATSAYLVASGNTSLPLMGSNNYTCFQCHNGFATIDYLLDRQGTPDASVLWGDANPTCYTCHDPHQAGAGKNVRIPVKLAYNSRFVDATKNPRGGINKFLDGTDIPPNVGTSIICLFCHQGRESGLTVYKAIKAANASLDPYTSPNTVINSTSGISFVNSHYLDTGSVVWSRNAWEFFFSGTAQRYYKGVPAHQETNCTGCHMGEANADNTEGGHTWKPKLETCKQCHSEGITKFEDIPATGDFDGDGTVKTAFEEIGTLGDPALGDSGLLGQLKARLAAQTPPIYYNPAQNPYFFANTGSTTNFTAWTTSTLAAAFNLNLLYKSGNCVPYHNVFYGAQILQDSLKALGVDTSAYDRGPTNRSATDYRTIVVNP